MKKKTLPKNWGKMKDGSVFGEDKRLDSINLEITKIRHAILIIASNTVHQIGEENCKLIEKLLLK
jgi:hypothetical protein